MVKPNIQSVASVRRRHVKATEAMEREVAAAAQDTINMVFWQIITQQADALAGPIDPADGVEEKEVHGVLTVPMEEITIVPTGFALRVVMDPENKVVRIHAIVQKEKSNILLADGSSLNG